jgi:hypothetical protein
MSIPSTVGFVTIAYRRPITGVSGILSFSRFTILLGYSACEELHKLRYIFDEIDGKIQQAIRARQ